MRALAQLHYENDISKAN